LEDPFSLIACDPQDFECRKLEACTKLANFIVKMYDDSLKSQVVTEIMRRTQFRYLLSILECYEKLQIYCNLTQDRGKGVTIKTQAIKLIVSQSREGDDNKVPKISTNTISKLIKGAVRVRRLLELAENNFGIIDGFPDLTINFFRGTRLNAVNFERWMKLVEENDLITEEEGRKLYVKYKDLTRETRSKNLSFSKKRKINL